jgi:hypothetical protein
VTLAKERVCVASRRSWRSRWECRDCRIDETEARGRMYGSRDWETWGIGQGDAIVLYFFVTKQLSVSVCFLGCVLEFGPAILLVGVVCCLGGFLFGVVSEVKPEAFVCGGRSRGRTGGVGLLPSHQLITRIMRSQVITFGGYRSH